MPQNFIFIGRSGCGKGTQVDLLLEHLEQIDPAPVFHMESGKKLRDFIKREGNYTSSIARRIYDEGGLQPEFLAVWWWSNSFVEEFKPEMHIVLDGAPRKLHEANLVTSALKFYDRKNVHVIFLDISREEAVKRLRSRGRFDDKEEEDINARLDWYETDVLPVINYFRESPDYIFHEINGEQSVEKIHEDIKSEISLQK
jgi:adenylate kinase